MEKKKENEGGSYRDKLNLNARQRYIEKLKTINNVDPYNLTAKDRIQDPDALPPLTYPDIVNYLVFGLSAYTLQEFKSYKSLAAHEHFLSGWVQDVFIHQPDNSENTIVLAEERYRPKRYSNIAGFWHKCVFLSFFRLLLA